MVEARASAACTVWGIVLVLLAGGVYYLAQTSIDKHRVSLPIKAYFECLEKLGAFDWSKVPGGKPGSSSEICKDLSSHR